MWLFESTQDGWRLVRFRFVLVGPWVLMTAILTLSYTATLQSHLTVTKLKPIPNTVEELAKNLATRPLLAVRDMSLSHRILVSVPKTYKCFTAIKY